MNHVRQPGPAYRLNLGDLFDRAGRLRPLGELPSDIQQQIASFDVVRTTVRRHGATTTTEEVIRVKTRARRTPQIISRGQTSLTGGASAAGPLRASW